ncbi:hypothetical protein Btru_016837 [Bulinus truncatus]|nr:hypothetical protein Btru_016837 [Bulinus truncatus]
MCSLDSKAVVPKVYAGYEQRIADLEKQLQRERSDFRSRLQQRDEEMAHLRTQLEDLEVDYAALLEIKIKLDREIEAYRKLLESEETRLNISSSADKSQVSSPVVGKKRQVDTDGKFIKLTNTTDKDIPLNHWQIKHTAGDNETRHKFGKNVIKAGQSITLWSADSDQTHNPPSDLVLKGKRWFVSAEMTTTLFDAEEHDVANCTMSKNIRSVSTFSQRRSGPRDDVDSAERQDKDNCHVIFNNGSEFFSSMVKKKKKPIEVYCLWYLWINRCSRSITSLHIFYIRLYFHMIYQDHKLCKYFNYLLFPIYLNKVYYVKT